MWFRWQKRVNLKNLKAEISPNVTKFDLPVHFIWMQTHWYTRSSCSINLPCTRHFDWLVSSETRIEQFVMWNSTCLCSYFVGSSCTHSLISSENYHFWWKTAGTGIWKSGKYLKCVTVWPSSEKTKLHHCDNLYKYSLDKVHVKAMTKMLFFFIPKISNCLLAEPNWKWTRLSWFQKCTYLYTFHYLMGI